MQRWNRKPFYFEQVVLVRIRGNYVHNCYVTEKHVNDGKVRMARGLLRKPTIVDQSSANELMPRPRRLKPSC